MTAAIATEEDTEQTLIQAISVTEERIRERLHLAQSLRRRLRERVASVPNLAPQRLDYARNADRLLERLEVFAIYALSRQVDDPSQRVRLLTDDCEWVGYLSDQITAAARLAKAQA